MIFDSHAAWALAAGYLLGSLPFATWIARIFYGVDISKVGSGNPGMTNVLRVLGWKPALPVAILDAAKGFLAAWLGQALTGSMSWALAAGLVAILGHSFTCFASFRGGKGVLTGFGIFLYFAPMSALATLAVFAAVVGATRFVSLGSMIAALVLPVSIFLEARLRPERPLLPVFAASILVGVFILYRHRANVARLLSGTENKIGGKGSWQERT